MHWRAPVCEHISLQAGQNVRAFEKRKEKVRANMGMKRAATSKGINKAPGAPQRSHKKKPPASDPVESPSRSVHEVDSDAGSLPAAISSPESNKKPKGERPPHKSLTALDAAGEADESADFLKQLITLAKQGQTSQAEQQATQAEQTRQNTQLLHYVLGMRQQPQPQRQTHA